ncbi:MAG: N-acetylneuraminate synthase [Phycisphaerales bacterium]|nr:MAG: N-acetylneuraminate synthase [Phycisphaerales bacterium]
MTGGGAVGGWGGAKRIDLGRRAIGDGCPTYIIAEAGVNHNGSLEQALALVDAAAECGADAVKFQWFTADALVTRAAPLAAYQRDGTSDPGARMGAPGEPRDSCRQAGRSARAGSPSSPRPPVGRGRSAGRLAWAPPGDQHEMLRRLELGADAFHTIARHCRQRGIDFLATPFSVEALAAYAAIRPPAVKIASTDIVNHPLLQRAASIGLPLLVSTGACTFDELERSVRWLADWGALERTVLLHCVSAYPTPIDRANVAAVSGLRGRFHVLVGYSDHTTSTLTGGWAVACGASVVEKHLTLDRSAEGPDHAMSLDPAGLREYVAHAREAGRALGDGVPGMSEVEQDVRAVARRSVVAAVDLPAGAVLTAEVLAVKRPGGGIEPAELDHLIGRRLTAPVAADEPLSWQVVR